MKQSNQAKQMEMKVSHALQRGYGEGERGRGPTKHQIEAKGEGIHC